MQQYNLLANCYITLSSGFHDSTLIVIITTHAKGVGLLSVDLFACLSARILEKL